MKVLLIEDNVDIGNNIKIFLEQSDFQVDIALDGEIGLQKGITGNYDMIVLDIGLPKIDGITVCKKIRQNSQIPIIIMTARGQDDDKILGLEVGADDYMVKPFKLKELEMRIKSILKRVGNQFLYTFGDIVIDTKSKTIQNDTKSLLLKTKEFQLLEYLLKYKTASRTELITHLWGGNNPFYGDNNLDVYISAIRRKVSKDIIITMKGFGYSITDQIGN